VRVSLYDPAAWRLRAVEIQMMLNGCSDRDICALLAKMIQDCESLAALVERRSAAPNAPE
jgi:hypothetical protein